MSDYYEEETASCPECGEAMILMRPGKFQENCDCHKKCPNCGKYTMAHQDMDKEKWGLFSGWFCGECGPLPGV